MADDLEAVAGGGGTSDPAAKEPRKGKMTDEELLSLIAEYEKSSLGSEAASGATVGNTYYNSDQIMTTLEVDRYNSINAYYARPLGNEQENSSQVVLPEYRDTVEWMMPLLMRIFIASGIACKFDPEGPDDVDAAEEESAAVNHVFMHMNDGFMTIHDYCKDALMMRNGYIRAQAEDAEEVKEETYSGLTELGVTALLQDKEQGDGDVEVIGQNETQVAQPAPLGAPLGTPDQPQTVFDLRIRIKRTIKKIICEAVPPEEMRIAAGTRSNDLNVSPFVEHKTKKTRSALITEGYDEDIVNSIAAVPDDWLEMDAIARAQVVDELGTTDPADFATQKIPFRNVTIICDYDGDGVSERRQVLIAGNKILENEVIEECPISSGSPKRMPHRHSGLSIYDEMIDIQVIKSELARQGLNNLRLANNGRIGVDWKNCNLSDLMTTRAGGVVRTNGNPQGVLMPLTHPSNIMEQVIPMMEYVDKWRTMRTGVGEHTMGLDPDALQDVTKSGQLAALSAASLKIEMVARLLAQGLCDTFLKIHALLIRHQDVPLRFQMGKQWKELDPRKWRKRTRITPNVGLGSGNREEARQNFVLLGNMQKEAAQMGLVGPKQVFNSCKMGINLLGFDHPEEFVLDPDSPQYKQLQQERQQSAPPDPRVQAAQINAKTKQAQISADLQETRMEQQTEALRAKAEMAHDALQNREDRGVQMAQADTKLFTDLAKILATIVAQQLKGTQENAGEVLRQDVQSLEGRGA